MSAPNQPTFVSIYTQDPGPPGKTFLGLEPILVRRIATLGWPVIIGMFTQATINTVDLLMIGRLPDDIAVPGSAAIFTSLIILWGFGGFLSAVSVGTQALSARRFSEGNLYHTGQVLTNSIVVAVLSSLVVTVIAELALPPIFNIMSPNHVVRDVGISFSTIRLTGLLGMALMASYKSFYDSIGQVKVHMSIALIMNVINAIVSYVLIFGGTYCSIDIAPMHVDGAAWGAISSSYAGLVIMILWSLRESDRARFLVYRWSNLNMKVANAIMKLSLWSGLATIILMSGVGMFNYVVSLVDLEANGSFVNSSAASIIINVLMLVFMSSLAFGTATATLVSQSVGAKLPKLAARYGWQSVRLAIYSIGIFAVIAVLIPGPLLRLFMPPELAAEPGLKDAVIAVATPAFRLAGGTLAPLAAAGLVLTQALYGAGETRYVMVVEFVLHFFFLVPLAWLLAIFFKMGLIGCFIAAVGYAAFLLLATAFKFRYGDWKSKVL